MRKDKRVLFGVIIFALAFFLRLFMISSVPPSPSLDEVSIGYNAYSILKTGADEFGYKFPLLLRAYDDWRPALYVYLVIPFVALLGLSAEAVRLPSVFLSLLSLVASFFIAKELFKKNIKFSKYEIPVANIPYLVMLLVAISPWHIYLSRLGHEVNLGLTITLLGIYFFLRAVLASRFGALDLVLSAVFFALSLYSYQSEKIFVPLFVLGALIIYRKKAFKNLKIFLLAGVLGFLVSLPAVFVSISPEGLTRLQGTSVFLPDHPAVKERLLEFKTAKEDGNILGQIYYNRRLNNAEIFSSQYFSHLNPMWIFWGNTKEDHKVPNLGLLYAWEIVFFLPGLAVLLFSSLDKRLKFLIFYWILISPIAGAVTTGAPHAMRSYTVIPSLQIITSLGTVFFYVYLGRFVSTKFLRAGFGLLVGLSVMFFSYQYFSVFPKLHSSSFQYPLAQALKELYVNKNIVVSNQNALNQSYMFYLFYNNFDPQVYQQMGGTESGGFAVEHEIGDAVFRPVKFSEEKKGVILVGNTSDFPAGIVPFRIYKALDGKEEIYVVEK